MQALAKAQWFFSLTLYAVTTISRPTKYSLYFLNQLEFSDQLDKVSADLYFTLVLIELKNGQKQGRKDRMQEKYQASSRIAADVRWTSGILKPLLVFYTHNLYTQ